MKIFGIGTDIVNIKRIDSLIKKSGKSFIKRVFSKKEIIYCEKKVIRAPFTQKDLLRKKL